MNYFTGLFIVLSWVVLFVYLFINSFSVKRTVEKQSMRWHFTMAALVIALVVVIIRHGGKLSGYARTALWPQTLQTGIIADAIVLLGIIVIIWARSTLGGNWSVAVTLKENHELIQRGPYRFVRHPMYSGLILYMLGTAVYTGKVVALVLFALVCIGLQIKSIQEERLLTAHFPETYPSYKSRVRALIPFVY